VATFTVWKFHTAEGAEGALGTLERLQTEELAGGALAGSPTHIGIDEAKLREAFSPED
jgi:hypothetical protein